MIESYDINDYLKDDKELQKAVIQELLKELSTQQGKLDAYQMSENEANEIIAELKEEVKQLHNCRNPEELYTLFGKPIKYWERLEQENYGLNQELLGYKKGVQASEIIELKQTLQEIKAIAETCCSEINCEECPFTDECNTEMEALGVCRMILKSISKAEEE